MITLIHLRLSNNKNVTDLNFKVTVSDKLKCAVVYKNRQKLIQKRTYNIVKY